MTPRGPAWRALPLAVFSTLVVLGASFALGATWPAAALCAAGAGALTEFTLVASDPERGKPRPDPKEPTDGTPR